MHRVKFKLEVLNHFLFNHLKHCIANLVGRIFKQTQSQVVARYIPHECEY